MCVYECVCVYIAAVHNVRVIYFGTKSTSPHQRITQRFEIFHASVKTLNVYVCLCACPRVRLCVCACACARVCGRFYLCESMCWSSANGPLLLPPWLDQSERGDGFHG